MRVYILILSLLVGLASLTEACEDIWDLAKCTLRLSQGRCTTNAYVEKNCQATCGFCDTTTTAPTTTTVEVYYLNIGFSLKF